MVEVYVPEREEVCDGAKHLLCGFILNIQELHSKLIRLYLVRTKLDFNMVTLLVNELKMRLNSLIHLKEYCNNKSFLLFW